ncbi:MAG: apolipoprotein N-acyltransferase [Bacteroidales bacterium]|jgi:apolipoprotein N-acyltransferase|nr:apolipoprotein N-acyltransferase [Bacteroidales bacterium]MDD3702230.1 apolipoprotein N-acyltransferase [Bacteroidales bacterium]MDY0368895.1 apolipoprotein N-acyltransferase [Bacteroidales bacterium]
MTDKIQLFSYFLLASISGVLMHVSWYPAGHVFLIFIAFVPILYLVQLKGISSWHLFLSSFISFFLFHVLAGYWMYSSTFLGSLLAHIFNSAYMAWIIWVYYQWRKRFRFEKGNILLLLALWLSFEWVHQYWGLAWPWFTLGHVFAEKPMWIQWYSYTGSAGGTAWILAGNSLITSCVLSISRRDYKKAIREFVIVCALIFLPIAISFQIVTKQAEAKQLMQVVVVQPNIHPTKEKFDGLGAEQQLERALVLAERAVTQETELLVFPETMLVSYLDEISLAEEPLIEKIRQFQKAYPRLVVLTGAFTRKTADWHFSDAQKTIEDSLPYVLYNSILLIDSTSFQVYHKSKLVPLVEKQPIAFLMKPLQKYIERSGGFFGSYGTHNTHRLFRLSSGYYLKPLICFESAFSHYGAISGSAALMVIVTNDGWWKSSGGYYQHLQLARLRAIENGLWVVRAANTGISAIIDPRGNIISSTVYGEQASLTANIPLLKIHTFFQQFPWLAVVLLVSPGWIMVLAAYWVASKPVMSSKAKTKP